MTSKAIDSALPSLLTLGQLCTGTRFAAHDAVQVASTHRNGMRIFRQYRKVSSRSAIHSPFYPRLA